MSMPPKWSKNTVCHYVRKSHTPFPWPPQLPADETCTQTQQQHMILKKLRFKFKRASRAFHPNPLHASAFSPVFSKVRKGTSKVRSLDPRGSPKDHLPQPARSDCRCGQQYGQELLQAQQDAHGLLLEQVDADIGRKHIHPGPGYAHPSSPASTPRNEQRPQQPGRQPCRHLNGRPHSMAHAPRTSRGQLTKNWRRRRPLRRRVQPWPKRISQSRLKLVCRVEP